MALVEYLARGLVMATAVGGPAMDDLVQSRGSGARLSAATRARGIVGAAVAGAHGAQLLRFLAPGSLSHESLCGRVFRCVRVTCVRLASRAGSRQPLGA